jgi:hypothetical protein
LAAASAITPVHPHLLPPTLSRPCG